MSTRELDSLFIEPPLLSSDSDAEQGLDGCKAARRHRRRFATSAVAATAAVLGLLGLSALAALRGIPWPRRAVAESGERILRLHGVGTQSCHTATPGENCYVDVQWARTQGIHEHPEWYRATCLFLEVDSSFEEFQACVYKINQTTCPLPCNPVSVSNPVIEIPSVPPPSVVKHQTPCHIAVKGESCFDNVLRVMADGGMHKYPSLNGDSTFEEIQAVLHKDPQMNCPPPCECHTATPTEACYQHVVWALNEGLPSHPGWYPNLSATATFEEVQAYLRKDPGHNCPTPCTAHARARAHKKGAPAHEHEKPAPKRAPSPTPPAPTPPPKEEVKSTTKRAVPDAPPIHVEHDDRPVAPGLAKALAVAVAKVKVPTHEPKSGTPSAGHQPCHTSAEGDACWTDLMFALNDGIYAHREWYPNLTEFSSLEQFQEVLHQNKQLHCAKPCPCHTATQGEECYDNIRWVIREGLEAHPEWYEGVTVRSRFEAVQRRLHEDAHSPCGVPCTPKQWGTPSLFCFSVFRSQGYELELVRAQVDKTVGIFKCDEFSVLSDQVLDVAKGIKTTIIPPCETVGVSKDGTAANTLVFMQAWGVVFEDARWRAHDWVVKADPDAVILVDRMRSKLAPHTGKNTWMTNCMKYQGPGWPMMFGSLEAFSNQAMETYFAGAQRCRDQLQWQAWGEDLYMGNCLSMLGATATFDGGLIGDNVCTGANCGDGSSAAYHPFKSSDAWFQCYNQAMR